MENLPDEILFNEIYPKFSHKERENLSRTNRNFQEMDRKYLKKHIGEFKDLTEQQFRDILMDLSGQDVVHFCNSNHFLRRRCEKDKTLWKQLLKRDFPMWDSILEKFKLPLTYKQIIHHPILKTEETQIIFSDLIQIPAEMWKLVSISKDEIVIEIDEENFDFFVNLRNKFNPFVGAYSINGGKILIKIIIPDPIIGKMIRRRNNW